MTTVSYSRFRQNLAHYLDKAEEDCEAVIITRDKGRKSIVVSYDDFRSLEETAYLLSSAKNRKHLDQSMKEAEAGKIVKMVF
ncbi:MAG: prevent-host-death protein [Candidatus Peribacteria bacterium]|nr:prevent-host-death protein [Candidatus Peribacteria bacterium]